MRRIAILTAALVMGWGPLSTAASPRHDEAAVVIPHPAWLPTWPLGSIAAQQVVFPPLIPPSCPNNPAINAPGVLCEDFDTDRNGVPGIQWSRLPVAVDPNDPLRAIGDPNDDILGYTQGGGGSPRGTAAVTSPHDAAFGYATCFPVMEENDWHLHTNEAGEGPGTGYTSPPTAGGPKAHGGLRSLHMGRHLSAASTLSDTIRFRQVSAFVLDSQGDPNLPGIAPGPSTTLEFWHMISVPDDENFGSGFIPAGSSFGGGQVQISLQDAGGTFGRWQRLTPGFNGYDSIDQIAVSLCGFDPGDDEALPDDVTLCDQSPLWADIGDVFGTDATCTTDTDGNDPAHKDCGAISSCTGGPGCTENGSSGPGVWARSAFDLSPFAGRVARLRWIGMVEGGWSFGVSRSALEPGNPGGYPYFEADDGWWIDDIVLTDLRASGLPCSDDTDGDGVVNCTDCATADPDRWAGPGEVADVAFLSDGVTLTWNPPPQPGATTLTYDTIRSDNPAVFLAAYAGYALCVESDDGADTSAVDTETPAVDNAFYYLVRPGNACPQSDGPVGATTGGVPRKARPCP